MGTFFSAFLSAISSPKPQETVTENSLNRAPSSGTLSKRKSKPELLIHRPVASEAPLVVHEFIWKYGAKEQVLLAGAFTNWSPSIQMVPVDPEREYWRALVELDPAQPWEFKFVVDGVWRCSLDLKTATDSDGNTNNIIYPE